MISSTQPPRSRRLTTPQQLLAALALLLIFALQLIHVARVYSANLDEAHHLYDGYNIWTHHDYRSNAEVPPLVKLTAALPLLPMHLTMPPNLGLSQGEEAFLDGRAFVFGSANGNNGDRLLFPARMACMIFPQVTCVQVQITSFSSYRGWIWRTWKLPRSRNRTSCHSSTGVESSSMLNISPRPVHSPSASRPINLPAAI